MPPLLLLPMLLPMLPMKVLLLFPLRCRLSLFFALVLLLLLRRCCCCCLCHC